MKKIILFDIDHTLFDTYKFRNLTYKKLASKLGLVFDEKFIEKTKEAEEVSSKAAGFYEPDLFMKNLIDLCEVNFELADLRKEFWKKENFVRSLYPDVKNVLKKLSEEKDLLIGILSTGDSNYQKKKIEIVKHYMQDEHIHIFVDKLAELQEVVKKYEKHQIFVVDNLLSILELAKKINSKVQTVHIKRPVSWHGNIVVNFRPDEEIKSLSSLLKIVGN